MEHNNTGWVVTESRSALLPVDFELELELPEWDGEPSTEQAALDAVGPAMVAALAARGIVAVVTQSAQPIDRDECDIELEIGGNAVTLEGSL